MPTFDILAAKQAGYTDTEIADFMGSKFGFDAKAAREAGYSDGEIIGQMSQKVSVEGAPASDPLAGTGRPMFGGNGPRSTMGIASPNDQKAATSAREFAQDVGNVASTAGARIGAGFQQSVGGAMQFAAENPGLSFGLETLGQVNSEDVAQKGREIAQEGRAIQQVVNEEKPLATRPGKILGSTVESIGANLPGMGAAMLGAPGAGLAMMGAQTFGQAYDEARAKGLPIDEATTSAAIQGGTEVATEMLPMASLAKYLKSGSLRKEVLHYYLSEIPGEHLATAVQNATGKAYDHPGQEGERLKAATDYLMSNEHKQDQIDTFFTTLLQGAVTGGMAKVARSGQQVAENRGRDLITEGQELTGAEDTAVLSSLPPDRAARVARERERLAAMRKPAEVTVPDVGITDEAVSVDDAIKAANAEVVGAGEWDQASRADLLKSLGGEEVETGAGATPAADLASVDPKLETGAINTAEPVSPTETQTAQGLEVPEIVEPQVAAPATQGGEDVTLTQPGTKTVDAGSSAQPGIRQESGSPAVSGEGIRDSRQEAGNDSRPVGAAQEAVAPPVALVEPTASAIPTISREDAIAAKQQVVAELASVKPDSDRAAQLQVQLDQYNKIIGGEAEYRDFQPAVSEVAAARGEAAPGQDWRKARQEAESNADAVAATIQPLKGQPLANHVMMNLRTMDGRDLGKISAPYDGSREDALRVAQGMKFHAAEEYDASLRDSEVFGTDERGGPRYAFTQGEGVTEIHDVVPTMSPMAQKAKALGRPKQAEPVAPATPTRQERVDAFREKYGYATPITPDTTRAILNRLANPKRLKDRMVQGLAIDHGKDAVNALVKQGLVRFPGQGKAEITKQGEAWLKDNPAPRTPAQQERMRLLEGKRKRTEKDEAVLAGLRALGEPVGSSAAPQASITEPEAAPQPSLTPAAIQRVRDLITQALPAGKVDLRIVDSIDAGNIPGMEEAFRAHGVKSAKVLGLHASERTISTGEVRSIITLSMDGATEREGYHETLHAAEALGLLSPQDLRILEREFPTQDGVDSSERRADAFADFMENGTRPKGYAQVLFGRIAKFLERLRNLLQGKGWRTAEDVFTDLMGGKLKRNARGEVDPPAGVQFMTAWHGSPHDHNKFSSDKIGSGEGNQAYGYGLYFAGNKQVAEFYKDMLSKNQRTFDPKLVDARSGLRDALGDVDNLGFETWQEAVQAIRQHPQDWFDRWDVTAEEASHIDKFLHDYNKRLDETKGKLYEVELAPAEDQYLLWDKPLSEQSEKVQDALESAGLWSNDPADTGHSTYKGLQFQKGSDKAASEYLNSLGIRGIKYLDGSSRNAGEGNYNYVIFNDEDVEIKNKFAIQQPDQRPDIPQETRVQREARRFQDRYNRVRVLETFLRDQGVQLSEHATASRGLYTMNGKVADQLKRFMDQGVQPLVKEAGKARISLGDIERYLLMQHAAEANAAMQKLHNDPAALAFGVTDAEARQELADFRNRPDFAALKQIADKFQAFSTETADMLLNAGIITQEMRDAWDGAYKHYVPLRGGDEDTKQGTGKGLRVNAKQQRRSGHGLRDEHVIENIIKARERAIKTIEKNNVALSVAALIHEADDDRIGTIGKPEKRRVFGHQKSYTVLFQGQPVAAFTNESDADAYVTKDRLTSKAPLSDYVLNVSSDPTVSWMTSPMLGNNEINAYINGHQVRIQINDEVAAAALTNMGAEGLNSLLAAGKQINNYLSRAYTGYDPRFTIRNTFRDFTAGMVNLTGDYGAGTAAKIAANYPKAVVEFIKARKDPSASTWVDRYRKQGGSTGASWLPSIERLGEDVQAMYQEQIGSIATYQQVYADQVAKGRSPMAAHVKATARAGLAGVHKVPIMGHFLKLIEAMNAVSENAFRVSTFMTLVEEGKSEAEAGEAAKGSTINFDKRGEWGAQMGALWLFFNPAVQGIQRTVYALSQSEHKHQAQALVGSMALVGFLAAEWARSMGGGDDDEWDKIPRHVKNRNLVIRTGEKSQVTLPLPYEYGSFVGIGYAMSDALHGKMDKRAGLNLAGSMLDGWMPLGNPITDTGELSWNAMTPTAWKMLTASETNKNSFGNNIAPPKYGREFIPDSANMNRATRGTIYDKAASALNEATGGTKFTKGVVDVSPEMIKFYTKSLLPGGFFFVSDVVGLGNILAHGEAPEIAEVPMASILVRENTARDTRDPFFAIANAAKEAVGQVSLAKKARDFDSVKELKSDNKVLLSIAKVAATQAKLAKAKRDAIDLVQQDDSLDFGEKRAKIKALEQKESEIYNVLIRKFTERSAAAAD